MASDVLISIALAAALTSFTSTAAMAAPKAKLDAASTTAKVDALGATTKTDGVTPSTGVAGSDAQSTPDGAKATDGDKEPDVAVHKEGADRLAFGAPDDEASVDAGKLVVRPYFLISGGLKVDFVESRPGEYRDDRVSTFALGRLGVRARWLDFVYAESEFMASGGVGLHGTSAYEGQAAMQVRQQMLRLSKSIFRVEVGRIIDEASVDFFSAHVADSFIQDTATRDPLLFSGFNLGNGVRGTVQILPPLRLGLTLNAGNPVSTTSSLLIGGAYPPFDRFYTQPYQQVNQSANHFPDDTFHSIVVTPSLLVDTKYVDTRLAVQRFDVNPNTGSADEAHILGYNLRGTARVKLFDSMIVPFLSGAYTRNDTLIATDLSKRAADRYVAVNVGGGVDVAVMRRYKCSHDCADGFGAQYQQVQFQIGDGLVTTQRYVNLGATVWLAPVVSAGLRFAWWRSSAEQPITADALRLGQTTPSIAANGERSFLATLRFVMR